MKKVRLLLCPLAALALVSCGEQSSSLSRQEVSSLEDSLSIIGGSGESSAPEESSNGGSALPPSSSSEAPKEPKVSDLTEDQYGLFPGLYLRKMASFSSFKAVTKGSTKATVLFVETTQSIDVTLIKSEYSYLRNESHSNFVNTFHEAYFHDDVAVSRDDLNKDFGKTLLSEYKNTYGVYPFDPAIEGYDVLSEGSVTKVEKVGVSEGIHTFKLTLDPAKSSNNVRIQMRKFGGLDDYPNISSVEISVSVADDYSPRGIHMDSKYKAKKFMESDCHQEYDVTFSDLNGTVEVPDLAEVREKYDF